MRCLVLACAAALFGMAAQMPREVCKSRCDSDYRLCQKRAANSEGRKTCKAMRKSCERGCASKS